ncbi:hypothetical protein BC834DRAFT_877682 [Gloeopeniophorella convolvens]|nr:hypothetical protein BC834DRAFT_877682 [Gloeopeniophorella convolvens]
MHSLVLESCLGPIDISPPRPASFRPSFDSRFLVVPFFLSFFPSFMHVRGAPPGARSCLLASCCCCCCYLLLLHSVIGIV